MPTLLPVKLPDGSALSDRVLVDADGLLVINKPPGLPTAGRNLDDTDCLQWHLMQACRRMVWAVHQLDADTSGVNVFVRRRPLVAHWQQALGAPAATKLYLAWVHGTVAGDRHDVQAPVGPLDGTGRVLGVHPSGRPAHTRFAVLDRGPGTTLLAARLFTGRTHQIRIHARHLGHPLVGDDWYTLPAYPERIHPRQALHAACIEGVPDARAPWWAPVPADLQALHALLGMGASLESAVARASAATA